MTLNFFAKIKADESKHIVRGRGIEFVLYKEEENWWPRLLNENKKVHWLKVDFNKWKDEDESGDETGGNFNENSYEDMMRQLGGGSEGFGNFNIDGDANGSEEDEEDLPELDDIKAPTAPTEKPAEEASVVTEESAEPPKE